MTKKRTPEVKEKAKTEFKKAKEEIKPLPTPDEKDLSHVGVEPKKRHRRTNAEIAAAKGQSGQEPPLTIQANPLFVPILKAPFTLWAKQINDKRIELLDNEALALALPVTQLLEHYFPKMPNIWIAWGNLIMQGYAVLDLRLKIIEEIKAKRVKPTDIQKGAHTGKNGVGQEFPNETPVTKV